MVKLAVVSLLMLCASGVAALEPTQEWGLVTAEQWEQGPPVSYPDVHAIKLFDVGWATAEMRGLELKRHVRIKVFDEQGVEATRDVVLSCDAIDDIGNVKAQILRPDGSAIEVDKKAIKSTKDDDHKIRSFVFEGASPGDILEYSFRIKYYGGVDKLGPEKYFMFSQEIHSSWYEARQRKTSDGKDAYLEKKVTNIPAWRFDGDMYALVSELTVKLGSDLDYTYHSTGLSAEEETPDSRRGKGIIDRVYKYHTWRVEDLPPAPEEKVMAGLDGRPALYFELFSTVGQNRVLGAVRFTNEHWQWKGESFQGYLDRYVKKSRSFRNHVKKLVADANTDLEKAVALYDHVTENYESVSDKLKLRTDNQHMKQLLKKKEGSRFELNILLTEMCRTSGLEAWPVLISSKDTVSFRISQRFNHLVAAVAIDSIAVFLDASAGNCPFGSLPSTCVVGEGLLVDYSDSHICPIEATECFMKP